MASSIPGAEAQLVAALAARTGLASALVQEGLPTEIPNETERVYLLGAENATRTRITEQGTKRETFTMPVLVEVRGYGKDSRADTKDRAWEIVGELEDTIAADPELDANVADATTGTITAPAARPTEDGWLMHITVDVNCVSVA